MLQVAMINLSKLRSMFRSQYLSSLEDEVMRLRAENRALLNSLLGTAGFPPVDFPASPQPRELPRLRRRSWHQLQALREQQTSRSAPDVPA